MREDSTVEIAEKVVVNGSKYAPAICKLLITTAN